MEYKRKNRELHECDCCGYVDVCNNVSDIEDKPLYLCETCRNIKNHSSNKGKFKTYKDVVSYYNPLKEVF